MRARLDGRKCHETIRFVAQFCPTHAPSYSHGEKRTEGLEFRTMEMTKATEQKQDSGRKYTNLDNRYGKIGISAVAAAMCHQGGQRQTTETHLDPYDRD